jgi:adenylate cyclase
MLSAGQLSVWLADNAALPMADLHDGYCRLLVSGGLPIWRSSLGIETLHPEETGGQIVWVAEEKTPQAIVFYHGVEGTSSYLDSPLRIVDETQKPYRVRLNGPPADMPLLREIQQSGATDYLIVPLPFLDRNRSASISFATLAKDGFSDAEIKQLEMAASLISPYAERLALRRIAVDLLETYVGRHAGERIYQGQVSRGAVDTIEAAILMADLRGFTALSSSRGLTHVVETLDDWFECIAVAVDANRGEILKFMGDGLLAIFPSEADKADACRRARTAALISFSGVEGLNLARAENGDDPVDFVVGLHVGEVAYGNVGGRRRLDFTVLGSAVNYASRLQDLAKDLGRRILVSKEFSALTDGPFEDLGDHPLRGIGDLERVFELPRPPASHANFAASRSAR